MSRFVSSNRCYFIQNQGGNLDVYSSLYRRLFQPLWPRIFLDLGFFEEYEFCLRRVKCSTQFPPLPRPSKYPANDRPHFPLSSSQSPLNLVHGTFLFVKGVSVTPAFPQTSPFGTSRFISHLPSAFLQHYHSVPGDDLLNSH